MHIRDVELVHGKHSKKSLVRLSPLALPFADMFSFRHEEPEVTWY